MAKGYEEFEAKMKKTSELLSTSFASVRAGRANAAVLDQIQVEYYGTPTPIQGIATISTPDPRSLLIQPWDSSTLKAIEKAILASDLGINPQNDGRSIRLVFPQLTEERRKEKAEETENIRLPRHIAIILDGNGRWAKKRGLPRTAGHAAGAETFRRIATYCKDIGIEYLTVYAFSTENWKRPQEEVAAIMGLLGKYLRESVETMERDHIKLKILGDPAVLSEDLRQLIDETADISTRYEGFQANVCLNYGGRDEIVRAAMRYAEDYKNGKVGKIDEAGFSNYMFSAGIPDPDLVIRPGGEMRLSNFLMWESAYSELIFTDVLWPDFTPEDIDAALEEYRRRDRRFGGIKK